MNAAPANSRRAWSNSDVALLRKLAAQNAPGGVIAHRLGRSESAVRAKAASLGLRLAAERRAARGR